MNTKEQDQKLAADLFKMPETVDLLVRYLVMNREDISPDAMGMKNEDLGELVKATLAGQKKIENRWATLKNLANSPAAGKSHTPPE